MEIYYSLKRQPYLTFILFYIILGISLALLGYQSQLSLLLINIILVSIILFIRSPQIFLISFLFCMPAIQILRTTIAGRDFGLYGFLNLLLFIFGLLYICSKRIRIDKLPIFLPYSLLIISSVISLPLAFDKLEAIRGVFRLSAGLIVYCLVYNTFREKHQIQNLLFFIVLSLIIPIVVGLRQHFRGEGMMDPEGALLITSTFDSHTCLGTYILICIVPIIWFLFSKDKFWIKVVTIPIGFFSLNLLYLTFSRAAHLGLFILVFVHSLLMRKKWLLFLLLLAVIFLSLSQDLPMRLEALLRPSLEFPDRSLAWRIIHWKTLFPVFLTRPIFGHGWRSAKYIANITYGLGEVTAHNDYLELAVDVGIFGLAAYIWLLIILLRQGIWLYKNAKEFEFRNLAALFIALILAWMMVSLFHELIDRGAIFSIFLAMASLVGSAIRLTQKEYIK